MLCAPQVESKFRNNRVGPQKFQKFVKSENGSLTIFTLFIFIVILMVTGMAVDLMRFESRRVALQSTIDRAVLAAADMDQSMDADAIVQDFVAKSGLTGTEVYTRETSEDTFRSVEARGRMRMGTIFMPLFGINDLAAPAESGATEGLTEVEISLVLDVSGSMGWNDRLVNLKVAAKEFIDTVLIDDGTTDTTETTHISIVPFSNQAGVSTDLASYMNFSGEHSNSYCVDWSDDDYKTTAIDHDVPLVQTSHFVGRNSDKATDSSWRPVCRTEGHRRIMAYENNPTTLKTFIESFQASGNTSVEIGAKWGSVLLDPSMQDVVSDMIIDSKVDAEFEGRPLAYNSRNILKVMIVMSDGANTKHWQIEDGYKSGMSPFWYDADSNEWSYQDTAKEYGGTDANPFWYDVDGDKWRSVAYGTDPQQKTWQQVWAWAGVKWFRDNIIDDMANSGADGDAWYADVVTEFSMNTDDTKDDRTSDICSAVRGQGVTVYTIGFETDDDGDRALIDCASSITHFYHANGTQISDVFASIASDITQLKLTY